MQPLKRRTKDEAIGKWPGILNALGVDKQFLNKNHGPCPSCQGRDRYRFDDKAGSGSWICSHCGSGDGFGLLNLVFGWDFPEAAKEVDRVMGHVKAGAIVQERSEESKVYALRQAYAGSQAVSKDDPVWRYLNNRVGIEVIPRDIRFHPAMPHIEGGMHPVMLSILRYPNGTAASIHRTYLTSDGNKANVKAVKKFMQGRPLPTAAVRLSGPTRKLGIAEGIENALAAAGRFMLPVWAATNAILMEQWMPPEGVEEVLIAGDRDSSYTGQAAAYSLAKRLARAGLRVEVRMPSKIDADWCDEI